MAGGRDWKPIEIVGGHPCLDFINTVSRHLPAITNDRFREFADVVTWGRATGVLSAAEAVELHERAERSPVEAGAALGQARALRAVLYRLLGALADGTAPDAAGLSALNGALRSLISDLELAWTGECLEWRVSDAVGLDVVARRIAWLSGQFVTGDLTHLHRCAGSDCAWLFLDTTRNHSRRWCAMSDCGSREKARRYYRRTRGV